MKFRLAVIVAMALLALSCKEKKETQEASYLVVNRQLGDSETKVVPDGGELSFTISCDAAWKVNKPEELTWVTLGDKYRKEKNVWTLPLKVDPNEGEYPRSGTLTFTADEYTSVVTLTQEAPDPLTLNKIPGFYGLEGGDFLVTTFRQTSSFHSGNNWSFRIIDPLNMVVYALGGIPEKLSSGDVIPVLTLKTVVQGMLEHIVTFTDVTVVKDTPTLVWLRTGETVFFIVER